VLTLDDLQGWGGATIQLLQRLETLRQDSDILVYDSWLYQRLWPAFGLLRAQGHWKLLSLSQLCYWENYRSLPSRLWHWLQTQATLRPAHAHIGVSQAVLEHDLFGWPSSNPRHIVHTGCDYANSSPMPTPSPLLASEKTHRTIISVGNYAERKGFHFLIEALHILHQTHPTLQGQIRLQLIGNLTYDKSYVERCQTLCKQWDIEAYVEFHGWKTSKELQEMYEQADLFALASQGEGWGMVVLEAMHHALPVLLGDFQTAFELLGDSSAGWVVPRAQPDAYARQIAHFLFHPEPEALRQAALHRAQALGQTWQQTATRFAKALQTTRPHQEAASLPS
jgi:glycosyltransferase involved in cell wall biosynthesis